MGDWLVRTCWAVAPDEDAAVAVYAALEQAAAAIRDDGAHQGMSLLRFGFAAPRVVVAIGSRKWGEVLDLDALLRDAGAAVITQRPDGALTGDLAALEPAFGFAWLPDDPGPVAVGALRVHRLPDAELAALVAGDELADYPEGAVLGVVSAVHGPIALAPADATPLFAARIDGGNNSVVIRDYAARLPVSELHDEVAWRMERHGIHHVFQTTAQRGAEIRAAFAAGDDAAGEAMARRWGLDEHGVRLPAPCVEPDAAWWHADVGAFAGMQRFHAAGEVVDGLIAGGAHARLSELACRFAELAHVVARCSYWMVRDGAGGPDLPARPAALPVLREAPGTAVLVDHAAARAALAMHARERDPARAATAALIALDAALDAAVAGRWWVPPPAWLEAIAHADATLAADADRDPTVAARPSVAALRETYRRLGVLQAAGDPQFAVEAEALLAAQPSPVAVAVMGTAGGLEGRVVAWTANWLAWHAHLRGDHATCLAQVARALVFAPATAWGDGVRDTEVRALLALGRRDEALAIVRRVLARDPESAVFADLRAAVDPAPA